LEARHQEKLSFKDPKEDAPDAVELYWAKRFEQLEHWIGLHVDKTTGMSLAFAIGVGEVDNSPYYSTHYASLFEEYSKRGRLADSTEKEFECSGTVKIKI
jgi:hypothetical protein